MKQRGSGILLHITSLPTQFGIGDLGPSAYKFAGLLEKSKQSYWQVLPLNITNPVHGNSPYSSVSAFAGNSLLISPEMLVKDGLLENDEILPKTPLPSKTCNYEKVIAYKNNLFNLAYGRFKTSKHNNNDYAEFCSMNAYWLDDFTNFVVLKNHFNGLVWQQWQPDLRDKNNEKIKKALAVLTDAVEKEKFMQYIFLKQWLLLKKDCNEKGIRIIGDIPIYVNYDSVDVWSNPGIFKLDSEKKALCVAGVPPDYFSKTGQLWGNPVYQWDVLKQSEYKWWALRIEHNLSLFDIVRVDHFRGLVAYWQVAAGEKTAVNGEWIKAPAEDFFTFLSDRIANLNIIAEDLGIITDDVKALMKKFRFPGMKVLEFAFSEDNPEHPYLPYNYTQDCVVYTGTHDNNTLLGWYEAETTKQDRKRIQAYMGKVSVKDIHWVFIRTAMMSIANTVVFPVQDILGLGSETRMNTPGTVGNNWQWRLTQQQMDSLPVKEISEMTVAFRRTDLPKKAQVIAS